MLVVLGEALVDLVIDSRGNVDAALGGAPFNTARAAARLGTPTRFGGAISVDRFGSMLAAQLERDGVDVALAPRTERPTTLAAAEIDESGGARYRFYFEGTSAPVLTETDVAAGVAGASVVFTGGLGLVLEPMASAIANGVQDLGDDVLLAIDVNCRPAVIPDRDRYLDRLGSVLPRVGLLKVSDEDLDYLYPGVEVLGAAERLLAAGPGAIVVTSGPQGTTVLTPNGKGHVDVDPIAAPIADTIGAGDTFIGGLLAWWDQRGLSRQRLRDDDLIAAVGAGHAAAAVVVTRRGAEPPHRHELSPDWV
jgi:fructokinase